MPRSRLIFWPTECRIAKEQLRVPARAADRQLIISQDISPLLRLAPARGDHHRDLGDAELPGGEHASMARDQPAVLAHQRRRRPAPLLDARGYRGDLERPIGSWRFSHMGSADRSPTARPYRPATAFDFRPPRARAR